MNRRTLATLIAGGLAMILALVVLLAPVPFVRQSPGPTVDVLGKDDAGDQVVEVEGHATYPTGGSLRLTTVLLTQPDRRLNILEALGAWVAHDVALLPYEAIYPANTDNEQERAESAAQMVGSQDSAIAAALTKIGYDLPTYAEVTGVSPGGPSEDVLKPRDRIVSLNGAKVESVEEVFAALEPLEPGDKVSGQVRRGGKTTAFDVTTEAAPDDPKRAIVGILVGTGYDFPFDVRIGISESIGGPSAGLIFSLAVYDTLTPGELTGGAEIAGTGTIDATGAVGPIGGIGQKIAGAVESGATVFLVPPANCAEALGSPVDAGEIELVRADTMSSAADALEAYAENPDADLPRCPS